MHENRLVNTNHSDPSDSWPMPLWTSTKPLYVNLIQVTSTLMVEDTIVIELQMCLLASGNNVSYAES